MAYPAFATKPLFMRWIFFGRSPMSEIGWIVELRAIHFSQHALLFAGGFFNSCIIFIHGRMLHLGPPEKEQLVLLSGRVGCDGGLRALAYFPIAQCIGLSKQKGRHASHHQTKKPQHVLHS